MVPFTRKFQSFLLLEAPQSCAVAMYYLACSRESLLVVACMYPVLHVAPIFNVTLALIYISIRVRNKTECVKVTMPSICRLYCS